MCVIIRSKYVKGGRIMASFKKKTAARIAGIVALCLLLNVILAFFITKTVYDGVFERYENGDCLSSGSAGASFESFEILSGENRLSAKLFDSEGDTLVVIAHGLNGCSADFYTWIEAFVSDDKDVFIFDMTGACESEGESSVGFYQASLDLFAVLSYIEKELDYEKVFLFGHSRGGYAACSVLSSSEHNIDGVISVSSPNSPMEAVICPAVKAVGPLAYGNYPMLWLYQASLFGGEAVSLSAAEAVCDSDVPVLVVHGNDDSTVPPDSFSLYSHKDEIDRENVQFLLAEGDHVSVLRDENGKNEDLFRSVTEFIDINCEMGGE